MRKKHIVRACDASNRSHPPLPNLQCPPFARFAVVECPPSSSLYDRCGSSSHPNPWFELDTTCTCERRSMRRRGGIQDVAQCVRWTNVHSRKGPCVPRQSCLVIWKDVYWLQGGIQVAQDWGFDVFVQKGFSISLDFPSNSTTLTSRTLRVSTKRPLEIRAVVAP